MRSDAYITVECDKCGQSEEVSLTATAGGYDERDVESHLDGWTFDDGDLCEDCSGQPEEAPESEAA